MDNVTTVLLIAPVTLLVCDRLGSHRSRILIAEVLASNLGGAATLIGDPPNIIIASRSGLTFNDFLINMAPMAALALARLRRHASRCCSAARSESIRNAWPT